MNKRNLAMLFGFLSTFIPFFGLPRGYQNGLTVVLGLAVVVSCLPLKIRGGSSAAPLVTPTDDVAPKA